MSNVIQLQHERFKAAVANLLEHPECTKDQAYKVGYDAGYLAGMQAAQKIVEESFKKEPS